MKQVVGLILLILVCTLWMEAAWGQEDMEVVDNSVFVNPQRPSSVFRHEEHNENAGIFECSVCHHVYENGKKIEGESSEDQRCVDCHPLKKTGDVRPLRKAFHDNCKQCHLQQEAGPVMCGECHRK